MGRKSSSTCAVRVQIGEKYTTGQVDQFVTESVDTGETVEEVCGYLRKHPGVAVSAYTIEIDRRLPRKQAANLVERCRPIWNEIMHRRAG